MPFNLTEQELQNAFEALEHHGYSGLVPLPPEWQTVRDNWDAIKTRIAGFDLDESRPNNPMVMFAPKTRATLRPVCLLHPIDLLVYSALTLIVKDDLEAERIPLRQRRVFSYRASGEPNRFYAPTPTFADYKEIAARKVNRAATKVVAIADIADFFPRIYHHRLENVIQASAKSQRGIDVARVLVGKFLCNISNRNSYGIPIGPFASRVLAEAVLIDVDAALLSDETDFIRWVDDYTIFCKSEVEAQRFLFRLSEHLFTHHGLTLSAIKTKILPTDEFQRRLLQDPEQELDEDVALLAEFTSRYDPYSDEEIELTPEEIEDLERLNFQRVLESALADRELVDYDRLRAVVSHRALLEKLSPERRAEIAQILLVNIQHLYPIADTIARFFQTFTGGPQRIQRRIAKALLRSIQSVHGKWPPDYHMVWILTVFAAGESWGGAAEILRIFNTHPSDVVHRFAALALNANGSRADAVAMRTGYANSSPLTRLAILLASRKQGTDERKHWRQTLGLTGVLERLL